MRFRQLAADQQDYLSCRLRALPPEQRQDVLAEWNVRCAAGMVRDAAAYLFGLIRKALQGTFRLWAARKNPVQARLAAKIQEAPKFQSAFRPSTTDPVDQPASREVALAHLQRIKAVLQGKVSVTHVKEPPMRTHSPSLIVRAMAQATSATGQPRPLADFLAPVLGMA